MDILCRVKHVLDHDVDSSLIHKLMLLQLKGAADERDDDELHGVRQHISGLLTTRASHQRHVVGFEAVQEVVQHLHARHSR